MLLTVLNMTSAFAAFAAAGLWWRSTIVKVPYDDKPDGNGWHSAAITSSGPDGEVDVLRTQDAANRLNNHAAKAAALAAGFQGMALALSALQNAGIVRWLIVRTELFLSTGLNQ